MKNIELAASPEGRPDIVVIGGGNGTSNLLEGLSGYDVGLSAIVATTDDGGSTGELRRQNPGLIGIGDIRQCMRALAGNRERAEMLDERDENGHAQGNLDLLDFALEAGGPERIEEAIDRLGDELAIRGKVLPVSLDDVHLTLCYPGDTAFNTTVGETAIAYKQKLIRERGGVIGFDKPANLNPAAAERLATASATIIAPGNFYGSIIPPLILPGFREALSESGGPLILVSNIGHDRNTRGFSLRNYLDELRRLARLQPDIVIAHNSPGDSEPSCPNYIELLTADIAAEVPTIHDHRDTLAAVRSRIRHNGPKVGELALSRLALV